MKTRAVDLKYFVASFFFSSRRRHTRLQGDWSSDVCSSDLKAVRFGEPLCLVVNAARSDRVHVAPVIFLLRMDKRSEERRVGKECRSRWSVDNLKKKK